MRDERTDPRGYSTTVVIPVKDDAVELARCLAALQGQSVAPDDVIVVDNGSADGSAAVACEFGARVIRCDQPGIPAASAAGYDAASTDLILRLDADCVPPQLWVEQVVGAFRTRTEVDAFTGPARFIDGPPSCRRLLAAVYLGAYVFATYPALGHRPLFGSNLAMRRSAWDAVRDSVHRDDPELHDDLDLSIHLGAGRRIGVLRGDPMGIAIRPLTSIRGFRRRIVRGFRTIISHWPEELPPRRWVRRLAARVKVQTRRQSRRRLRR